MINGFFCIPISPCIQICLSRTRKGRKTSYFQCMHSVLTSLSISLTNSNHARRWFINITKEKCQICLQLPVLHTLFITHSNMLPMTIIFAIGFMRAPMTIRECFEAQQFHLLLTQPSMESRAFYRLDISTISTTIPSSYKICSILHLCGRQGDKMEHAQLSHFGCHIIKFTCAFRRQKSNILSGKAWWHQRE